MAVARIGRLGYRQSFYDEVSASSSSHRPAKVGELPSAAQSASPVEMVASGAWRDPPRRSFDIVHAFIAHCGRGPSGEAWRRCWLRRGPGATRRLHDALVPGCLAGLPGRFTESAFARADSIDSWVRLHRTAADSRLPRRGRSGAGAEQARTASIGLDQLQPSPRRTFSEQGPSARAASRCRWIFLFHRAGWMISRRTPDIVLADAARRGRRLFTHGSRTRDRSGSRCPRSG